MMYAPTRKLKVNLYLALLEKIKTRTLVLLAILYQTIRYKHSIGVATTIKQTKWLHEYSIYSSWISGLIVIQSLIELLSQDMVQSIENKCPMNIDTHFGYNNHIAIISTHTE